MLKKMLNWPARKHNQPRHNMNETSCTKQNENFCTLTTVKMNKKRKRFIFLTIVYEVVLFTICLLVPILVKEHTEALVSVSIILFIILGIPLIIANEYFYELFDKENRKKLREEKEKTKHKNELLRAEFDLPDYIETQYDNRLVTKPRLIVAIVFLVIGIIVTFGSGITFGIIEYENTLLEVLLIVLGLAIVVYSFFIALNKPIWGLVHSTVPFVCFFPLPVILKATKVMDNDIIITVLTIVSGIAFYSIFLILTVVMPKKRIKAVTSSYIRQFEMKNEGYKHSKFSSGLHSSCHVSEWFYNPKNGKKLMICTIGDGVNYLIISANVRYGKYLLKDAPIVFEKNVEVNKNIIQKIMDE